MHAQTDLALFTQRKTKEKRHVRDVATVLYLLCGKGVVARDMLLVWASLRTNEKWLPRRLRDAAHHSHGHIVSAPGVKGYCRADEVKPEFLGAVKRSLDNNKRTIATRESEILAACAKHGRHPGRDVIQERDNG